MEASIFQLVLLLYGFLLTLKNSTMFGTYQPVTAVLLQD